MIGVTTLDAMAAQAVLQLQLPYAVVVADAKRDEVYLAARSAQGEILVAPELIAVEAVVARLDRLTQTLGVSFALAGTAAEIVSPSLLAAGYAPVDSLVRQPDAVFVAKLAADAPVSQTPKPLYLREPDAKLPAPR